MVVANANGTFASTIQDHNDPTSEKAATPPRPKRKPRPNYAKIHARPLPLEVFPLPAFVPHNPLSLLRILSAMVSELFSRETSRSSKPSFGYFSSETRSVHVTDPRHIRLLWEMGFFGKGTLSRSEPSWLKGEEARRKEVEGGTSEEWTMARREERRLFKLERARAEREAIEQQLRAEGKLGFDERLAPVAVVKAAAAVTSEFSSEKLDPGGRESPLQGNGHAVPPTVTAEARANGSVPSPKDSIDADMATTRPEQPVQMHADTRGSDREGQAAKQKTANEVAAIADQEHLQLTLHEAFFLAYGLGALTIINSPTKPDPLSILSLLPLFAAHSTFPPSTATSLRPDNPFLLSYAVYHHYRSLGWVPRAGSKFAVDWLLYVRGPVFDHADFAVVIVPEYPEGWEGKWGGRALWGKATRWWEMHCHNRVLTQVYKTLVLCYVEVPLEVDWECGDVGKVLKGFTVRDFAVRRWLANRSRD